MVIALVHVKCTTLLQISGQTPAAWWLRAQTTVVQFISKIYIVLGETLAHKVTIISGKRLTYADQ